MATAEAKTTQNGGVPPGDFVYEELILSDARRVNLGLGDDPCRVAFAEWPRLS